LRDLERLLEPLRTKTGALTGVPAADARDAQWVEPSLVGEVEFGNWTPGGILRHARWRGLRPDKSAGEVVIEERGADASASPNSAFTSAKISATAGVRAMSSPPSSSTVKTTSPTDPRANRLCTV